MSEEIVGKRDLTWFIAQTTADIEAIDIKVADFQAAANVLRAEQVELVKVLKKLTAVDVAEPEEPVPP